MSHTTEFGESSSSHVTTALGRWKMRLSHSPIDQEVRVPPRMIAPLLLALALVVPAGSAAAEPYAPQVPTRVSIVVKAEVGERIAVVLRVSANAEERPTGTLEVSLTLATPTARGADSATAEWSTTARYDGGRLLVEGPELAPGAYVASAAFAPDTETFLPSEEMTRFRLGGGDGDGDADGDSSEDNGGILPDTGGPNLLWLLLGTALVGGGVGVVVYVRRRQAAAASVA